MIKFGPSGNCESFYAEGNAHTEQAAAFVRKRGLDCFEYSFGRGVNISEKKAVEIGNAFKNEGVEISVHAPYFINFANLEDDKIENRFLEIPESMTKEDLDLVIEAVKTASQKV